MINNFCTFFKDIELDPTALVPDMTVGEWFQAKDHIQECNACMDIVNRVADMAPDEGPTTTLN